MNKLLFTFLFFYSCLTNSELFNFKFYSELSSNNEDKNMFFSSYSLEVALSMLSEGCKGDSAEEIFNVCSIPSSSEQRHKEMQQSISLINTDHTNFELKTANAIWPLKSTDFILQNDFKNTIENVYQGGVKPLDFIKNPSESTKIINNWVYEQTNKKIKNLLPQGSISDLTRLVITNCIYFKAQWAYQFNPMETFSSKFYLDDINTTPIEMMHQLTDQQFKYYQDKNVEMIQLPYKGKQLSMYVLLPYQDMETLEKNLDFFQWRKQLEIQNIDLYLPKFEIEWSEKLVQPLQEMGITSVFNQNADLSGIDGERDLLVTKILQKAIISVDEFGTEAAAATAIILDYGAYPLESIVFKANRPFIFMIMHEETELILFMGKLMNPANKKNNYEMTFGKLKED